LSASDVNQFGFGFGFGFGSVFSFWSKVAEQMFSRPLSQHSRYSICAPWDVTRPDRHGESFTVAKSDTCRRQPNYAKCSILKIQNKNILQFVGFKVFQALIN